MRNQKNGKYFLLYYKAFASTTIFKNVRVIIF
jgi:hypothetical protein